MSFTYISFIYYFLPLFLLGFYLLPRRLRTGWLCVASLLFYAWGGLKDLAVLLVLTLVCFAFSRLQIKTGKGSMAGAVFCLAVLAVFKYLETPFGFPLGVSFYTFHLVSYLIDVRREPSRAGSFGTLFAYVLMFPKLIMGPIVTWHDLSAQMEQADPDIRALSEGLFRFAVGLGKKTLLAMQLAPVTESLWMDAPNSGFSAWLGIICYTLQLYFDFSGYSDMAIGIGKAIGLDLGEHFLHPYCSHSVSEFYRRWHASLGNWFKEYLYYPLGGNRKGNARTLLNIMIVWLATGVWHGNTLNFPVWGIGLGVIICIERLTGLSKKTEGPVLRLWTVFWVMMGWVMFNAADLPAALDYYRCLFRPETFAATHALQTALHDTWYVIAAALIGTTPYVRDRFRAFAGTKLLQGKSELGKNIAMAAGFAVLLAVSTVIIINTGFSAFIYTKF
ncbi:MAG: MBOAT family protein [Firmicutes bacterium]|nr:MBOAT family protein [Bacillota bacterium]